jgi:hypothetical protein
LIWINCKWTPEDKRSTWTKLVDKFKPSQLQVSQFNPLCVDLLRSLLKRICADWIKACD